MRTYKQECVFRTQAGCQLTIPGYFHHYDSKRAIQIFVESSDCPSRRHQYQSLAQMNEQHHVPWVYMALSEWSLSGLTLLRYLEGDRQYDSQPNFRFANGFTRHSTRFVLIPMARTHRHAHPQAHRPPTP